MEKEMIYFILDIFFYNYTSFKTCLFILNINNKNIFYNLVISLYIDIFITHTYILVTLYILVIYLIHKYIKLNYYNIIYYYLFNILVMFIFYNKLTFVINSLFILGSYIKNNKNINLIG